MLKRSDVVQIPFPFSDLTHQKRRPVMLLTSPDAFATSSLWQSHLRQGMMMPSSYKMMILLTVDYRK